MGQGGVENSKKSADVLYGRPLTLTLKQGISSLGRVSAGASRINSSNTYLKILHSKILRALIEIFTLKRKHKFEVVNQKHLHFPFFISHYT